MPEWVQYAERFGIPFIIIAFGGYGVWHGVRWFGTNIALPIRDRHFVFLDAVIKNIEQQTHVLNRIEPAIDKLNDTQEKQAIAIDGLNGRIGQLSERIEDLRKP